VERPVLRDRSLAVFVDDTGHESLKGQPVYGLGGCAVLAATTSALLISPGGRSGKHVAGSPDAQLHANKFSGTIEDIEIVARFFGEQPFWRFAAVITEQTTLAHELTLLGTMRGALERCINDIVGLTLCEEVKVVFESSHRANRPIQSAFQSFEFSRESERIPSECGFMPKSLGEPGLEVADFAMHAVGRQARRMLTNRDIFLPDFRAVFHTADPTLSHFNEVVGALRLFPIDRSGLNPKKSDEKI
jgi:hypothetical protein